MAGHGQDVVDRLKERMLSQPHLFEATAGFVHEVAQMIGTSWWAAGSSAPRTPMTDRDKAAPSPVDALRIPRQPFELGLVPQIRPNHKSPPTASRLGCTP